MRRKVWCLAMAMCLVLGTCLTACGKEDTVNSEAVDHISAETKRTEENIEPLPLKSDYVTDEMYARATEFIEGDLTRLAQVMRKAKRGETITVGVIGGSITERYSASTYEKCYASYVQTWWEERFPETEVNFINAGIGGTSSYLGVHRVGDDLLYAQPDIVVVEFSVNDGNDNFYKKSYDNLVRRIMLEEQEPAVMLLFTTQENGTNAQANDALIGFKYRLPMLSYGNAVLPSIEEGEFAWKDISPDDVHPNDRGHAIIGELFYRYLNDVYARLDEISTEVTPFTEDSLTKEIYLDAKLLDSTDIQPVSWGSFEERAVNYYLPNNWYTETGEESIVFQVEAANIGIAYQRTTDGTYGQYEVYIDGAYVHTLDGNFTNGWGSTLQPDEVYLSDEPARHTIEIRKKEGSTGDKFAIVALLVS